MRTARLLAFVACGGLMSGCAATVPTELAQAREAYKRASSGEAAQVAPAELHVANDALIKAEQSFQERPYSYRTHDLAYVALRKTELAEAMASITNEQKSQARSKSDYQEMQGKIVTQTQQDLSNSQKALAESQKSGEIAAERLSTEQAARTAADERAATAQAALAKLAEVKEEPRGMVITLSGSVLFGSNQATLLPAARERLSQVADVLLATSERNVVIEGHTDSQGSDAHNLELSQRRAEAVRKYFVQRGYQPDRISAAGLGEAQPVTENTSAEGRANNRRVEIIIEREPHASIQ